MVTLSICGERVCSKFEACNVLEFGFPPPPTTTQEPEGSGEGSGEDPLVYDENLLAPRIHPPNPQNYTSVDTFNLCSCLGDSTCPDGNSTEEDSKIRLDAFLALTFCRPVIELFPHPCRGRRALTRVFGNPGISPDPILTTTMNFYSKTRIYCHCKSGNYKKLQKIETWNSIYAYLYQCRQWIGNVAFNYQCTVFSQKFWLKEFLRQT